MATRRSWIFDQQAIKRARAKLGIESSTRCYTVVKIPGAPHAVGDCDYGDDTHWVRLIQNLNPKEANQTTWHELTHALQLERDFDGDMKVFAGVYNDTMKDLGVYDDKCNWTCYPGHEDYGNFLDRYYSHPYEVEARKNERCMAWRYPLVTAR